MPPRDPGFTRFCRASGLALLVLVASSSIAAAQALDTPSATVTRAGFFRIDIDVQAGRSGAPNGFVIQWMKRSDFEAFSWPADPYDPRTAYCEFTGVPTLNPDARSATFALDQNGVIQVQVGDLFDETGVYASYEDQLPPGDYVFRVWAEGSAAPGTASAPSGAIFAATTNPECTQGFWKTHPEAWPVGCTPMLLGTVSYSAAELLSIFNQPAAGNGILSLAHQLIATKLNLCNGSSPTNIAATIAAADALIGGLVIPPGGVGFLSPASTSALTNTLDNYNNGILPGVVSCAVPVKKSTWGGLKAMYR